MAEFEAAKAAEAEDEQTTEAAAEEEEGVYDAPEQRLTFSAQKLLATRYPGTIPTNRRFQDGRRLDSAYWDYSNSRGPDGADTFAAGGPACYRSMPTATAWEKLQYLIVLTHCT
ncbi:hypothetical protein PG994_005234 [Apiospora phragmitis]|uniref:Uncharacterized protein n=1 Tax=Apiospora phragmitis TaxID=2905665 RepID=A0ABR1VSV1_9PEZI